jgi:hypothetical protein
MTTNNWWSKKLGTPEQPQQTQQPSSHPVYQPANPLPVQQSYPQSHQSAPVTPVSQRCPGCGSSNYGGATPEARKRCYDCGYPITQSGSGMGPGIMGQGGGGSPQPSRQVQTGGWNPTTIIGKL